MRFGGFSEFSHDSMEHINEAQELARKNQELLRSLETIEAGRIQVEIAQLNKREVQELQRLSQEANALTKEIQELQLQSTNLFFNSIIKGIKLPKDTREQIDYKLKSQKGTLSDAREELKKLTLIRNNLKRYVEECNQTFVSHNAIYEEVQQRIKTQNSINEAIERNNEAIDKQLHPSGKSAKESAEFFIEQEKIQVQKEAKERFIQQKNIEQAIARNNEAIDKQLHPSGKSAKESAEFFIKQLEEQEKTVAVPEAQQELKNSAKGIENNIISVVKSHKKLFGIVAILGAFVIGAVIFIKKKIKSIQNKEINTTKIKPMNIDEFKKQTAKVQ